MAPESIPGPYYICMDYDNDGTWSLSTMDSENNVQRMNTNVGPSARAEPSRTSV